MINFFYLLLLFVFSYWLYRFIYGGSSKNPFGISGKLIWTDKGKLTRSFYNNDFEVFGKPDFLYREFDQIIAVEFKSRFGPVFESDIVQAKAAALAARGDGYMVSEIIIKTSSTLKRIVLPLADKDLFAEITQFVSIARNAKAGLQIPASPSLPKCRGCAFNQSCKYNHG